jgi:uncharacterized membrane protein YccC
MELGIGELVGAVVAIIGAGWVLLQLAFRQFELRLDDKFKAQGVRIAAIEGVTLDIKRLELEVVKRDSSYVSRQEYNLALQRIFDKLELIDGKLSNKVDRSDCQRLMGKVTQ